MVIPIKGDKLVIVKKYRIDPIYSFKVSFVYNIILLSLFPTKSKNP
jgi:hypothetical protein